MQFNMTTLHNQESTAVLKNCCCFYAAIILVCIINTLSLFLKCINFCFVPPSTQWFKSIKPGKVSAHNFDDAGSVHLSGKVSFGLSAQHLEENVLPQLVERKQYQKFQNPLPEIPKTFVTYRIVCSLRP